MSEGEVLVQCVNPFTELVELPAGSLVGKFHSMQGEDVGPTMEMAKEAREKPTTNGRGPVPEHWVNLYGNACDGCESGRKSQVVAQLLFEY